MHREADGPRLVRDGARDGLARALLNAGFRGMARAGRTSAVVWVIEANPSRFFYERMGGRLVAHRRESFAGTPLGVEEKQRLKPRVISSQIIRNIDPHQVQLVNRMRFGHMLLAGQTLYVLEVEPAGYAALAANEAEKAANLNILEVRAFGSFGRVYLGGDEQDIMAGYGAAVAAIEAIDGREIEVKKR